MNDNSNSDNSADAISAASSASDAPVANAGEFRNLDQFIETIAFNWTERQLNIDPTYHSGYGPDEHVLDDKKIRQIYDGLERDVHPDAAKNFVQLVKGLENFAPTAFLSALIYFWSRGCQNPTMPLVRGWPSGAVYGHYNCLSEELLVASQMSVLGRLCTADGKRKGIEDLRSEDRRLSFEIKQKFLSGLPRRQIDPEKLKGMNPRIASLIREGLDPEIHKDLFMERGLDYQQLQELADQFA